MIQNPNAHLFAVDHLPQYVGLLNGAFHIYAEAGVPEYKVLFAASVAGDLLDLDENGEVDDPKVRNAFNVWFIGCLYMFFRKKKIEQKYFRL